MPRARWWMALFVLGLAGPAPSAPAQTINWQEAVARLAQEREQAVTCAGLLKKHGDAAALDRGSLAYGKAKAEYDGVIAGLSVALAQRQRPASLGDLEERLGRGVAARGVLQGRGGPHPGQQRPEGRGRGDREGRRGGRRRAGHRGPPGDLHALQGRGRAGERDDPGPVGGGVMATLRAGCALLLRAEGRLFAEQR